MTEETEESLYEPQSLRKHVSIADTGRDILSLYHIYGIDNARRGNLYFIDENKIIYASNAAVVIEDLSNGNREYILGIEDGIGCIVVHPSRKYFAVGAKGQQPNIYIYSYPDLKIRKILKNGAEKGYSCMSFTVDGETLATVSMAPDYMLTIWEWKTEQMGLHSKAFGQDVWNVKFSEDDPRRLTTSGIGHIRFWKMASTFTGLKLQGYIGKFGKVDLSDIDEFMELPDGKVISGTENGSLLLWEGNFIKCRFVQVGGGNCHEGTITYLRFNREDKYIISAGLDGYLRYWDFHTIDAAEVDADHSMDFELLPLAEYLVTGAQQPQEAAEGDEENVPCQVGIKQIVAEHTTTSANPNAADSSSFVLYDTLGRLQKVTIALTFKTNTANDEEAAVNTVPTPAPKTKVLQQFHSQEITGMDTCPNQHLVATASLDGQLKVISYLTKQELCTRQFTIPITSLKWLPLALDNTGSSIIVGFEDGIVRIFGIVKKSGPKIRHTLVMRLVFKPHTAAVINMIFNNTATHFASSGKDGIIFFHATKTFTPESSEYTGTVQWMPLRFINLQPYLTTNSNLKNNALLICERMSWSEDSRMLLLSCNDLILREVMLSKILEGDTDLSTINGTSSGGESVTVPEEYTFEIVLPCRELMSIGTGGGTATALTGSTSQISLKASASSMALGKGEGNGIKTTTGEGGEESPTDKPSTESTKAAVTASSKPTNNNNTPPEEELKTTWKMNSGIYTTFSRSSTSSIVASGNITVLNPTTQHIVNTQNLCVEMNLETYQSKKITLGLYSSDGKECMKHPLIHTMAYTWSKKFLLLGLDDGSVVVKPSDCLEIFAKQVSHNGNITTGGSVTQVASSFDDKFIFSTGKDGNLVIHRMRLDLWLSRSQKLFLDLDAGIYGEEIMKEVNNNTTKEPQYLSYYTTNEKLQNPSEEGLFEMHKARKPLLQDVGITESQLTCPIDRETSIDLASNAYSIQDNRLKAEEDMKKISAEDLKQRVIASIRTLRKDYEKIVKENEQMNEKVRLSKQAMCVDNEYFEHLQRQGELQQQEVMQECAYENEKALKLLHKLQSRLLNGLLLEEMPLFSFDTLPKSMEDWSLGKTIDTTSSSSTSTATTRPSMVYSLRVNSLDTTVQRIIQQVKQQVRDEQIKESQQRAYEIAQKKAMMAMDDLKTRKLKNDANATNAANNANNATDANKLTPAAATTTLKKSTSGKGGSAVGSENNTESSVLQRRMNRKERKNALNNHELHKPNENQDADEDILAIKFAEKTIGDYKLKCSDDYEVPEESRINAMKKMRQMAMLEDSMMTIRLAFNEKFLFLRNLKKEIIFSIQRNNQRIKQIDIQLNQSHLSLHLWEPMINPLEFPEDYDEVTVEELTEYLQESQHKSWENMIAPKHTVILGKKVSIVRNGSTNKTNCLFDISRHGKDFMHMFDTQIHISLDAYLASYADTMLPIPERTDFPKYYETSTDFLANKQLVLLTSLPTKLSPSTGIPISSTVRSTAALQEISRFENTIPSFEFVKSLQYQQIHHQTNPASTSIPNKRVVLEQQKLLFERMMIFQDMAKNITTFHEAIHSLRTHRHQVISDLKLAEFKLLILYQEYKLLQTFENKDLLLQLKQQKNKNDDKENYNLLYENKSKFENKQEEIAQWNEKLVAIMNECKGLLPENHPYGDILMKIFKKKIKRMKGGGVGGSGGTGGGGGGEEEEDEEEDEDEEGDDEEDDDDLNEIEDICPPGCDMMLYEKILDLREKKLETEEVCNDIQKVIEELKRTVERLKSREKQINKESQQTEYEVTLFQLTKQMALNQLRVIVPLKISQLYMFEASGCLTGPNSTNGNNGNESVNGNGANGNNATANLIASLLNPTTNTVNAAVSNTSEEVDPRKDALLQTSLRSLISSIKLKTHTLFSTKKLKRLQNRINELYSEIIKAKQDFKNLYGEKNVLLRQRESKEDEKSSWQQRCLELQMLKFGREIDLDELEACSDRTKELEMENILENERNKFEKESLKFTKQVNQAKEKLMEVTKENTKLLEEVAKLTELKMKIAHELNAPGQNIAPPKVADDMREMEERNRIKAYVNFQATELNSLRTELNMLKRKEAPLLSATAPLPPIRNLTPGTGDIVLPPIPTNKRK